MIRWQTEGGAPLSPAEIEANWRHLQAMTSGNLVATSPVIGAVGDGVTSDATALQRALTLQKPLYLPATASGEYYIGSTIRPPDGGNIHLEAVPRTVTLTGPKDGIPFGKASGANTAVKRITLRGLDIDGKHVRGSWPYSTASSNYGIRTLFSITADSNVEDTEVVIDNCHFKNFMTFPFQLWHFKRVIIIGCKFTRCKDPGFLFCQNVFLICNTVEYSADNGLSASRGCKGVVAIGNIVRDCEIAGLWVAGYTPSAITSSTLTVTGTYTAMGAVTVTSSDSSFWNKQYLNTYFTITKGSDTVTVKITSITSFTVATGYAVQAVPAALQGAASDSWVHAPGTGPCDITAIGNFIEGCDTGIRGTGALCAAAINGNTIRRSGYCADSEVATTGLVATGSNSMTVADGSIFAQNDWIIVRPKSSLDPYFIAKISSKAGNVLTLDRNAPRTYVLEPVHLCHQITSSGVAILITGEDESGVHQYAEGIVITGNVIQDFYKSAVRFGSTSTGSVRHAMVHSNSCMQPGLLGDSAARGVVELYEYAAKPSEFVTIKDNTSDDTAAQMFRAFVRGTSARAWKFKDNLAPSVTNSIKVFNADNANADITATNDYTT